LDATNVSIAITTSDPLISVEDSTVNIPTLTSGDERSPKFSINIDPDAMAGKYKIRIITQAASPFQGDVKEIFIRVLQKS